MKKVNLFVWGIGILCLIVALCVYPILPDTIPIHWDFQGNANGFGGPINIFLSPMVALCCDIGMVVSKKIDPKREQYVRFLGVYQGFRILFAVFMAGVFALMILQILYPDTSYISIVVPIATGILFLYIGNEMPKIRPNYFFGIKTPWTLADEDVWRKTHRIAGRIWVLCAILFMLIGCLPDSMILPAIIIILIFMVLYPVVYSYLIFRKQKKEKPI